jgi:hypothetical protein
MTVYKPDGYTVSIGIPKSILEAVGLDEILPAFVEIKNWTSISTQKQVARFQYSNGIFGEPFVEMTRNTSRVFSFNILQSSDEVRILRELLRLQTFGFIGFGFSIFDNSTDSNDPDKLRQKSIYPVAFIIDEPAEGWAIEGTTWVYQIQLVSGQTIYT